MSFWHPLRPSSRATRARRRRRVALLSSALMALSVIAPVGLSASAQADDPDGMHLTKTVSASTVAPLEQFHFDLTYDCFSNTGPCVDAKIVDTLPPELEIVQVAELDSSTPGTVATSGNTVTATFTKALDGGGIGLDEGSTGTLTIIARFKDRTVAQGGTTVTNTAVMTAAGHDPAQSSVDVSVVVGTRVTAGATKEWAASTSGVGGKRRRRLRRLPVRRVRGAGRADALAHQGAGRQRGRGLAGPRRRPAARG
jgi:fimbrial isopeptide formation D2 family protein